MRYVVAAFVIAVIVVGAWIPYRKHGASHAAQHGMLLRDIGSALFTYHMVHGAFPEDGDWRGIDDKLESLAPETAEKLSEVRHEYKLVGRWRRPSESPRSLESPPWPIIYEDPAVYDHCGTNVLFVDGHVEFVSMDRLRALIDERTHVP